MGADDVIRKPFSQRLLVERVKAVLRRASPKDGKLPKEADSKVLERGPLHIDLERHTCTWKNQPVTRPSASARLLIDLDPVCGSRFMIKVKAGIYAAGSRLLCRRTAAAGRQALLAIVSVTDEAS